MRAPMTIIGAVPVLITLASAQNQAPQAIPVQMIVTVKPSLSSTVHAIGRGDVEVLQGDTTLPVTEWLPLEQTMAALDLYIFIDERLDPAQPVLFEEIRRFISSQPATTAIGVASMDNGRANIIQPPTKDHARAASAIRLPTGDNSAGANPFTSVSSLIYGWSAEAPRREVLAITDGIDVFDDEGGSSAYLDIAVADAQRAGVQVFSLFALSAGHADHRPKLIHNGQVSLARLAEQTGGEAYFKDGEPSSSFAPYFANLASQLAHQYRVTFLATPIAGEVAPIAGRAFQGVAFRSKRSDVELTSAHGFYVAEEGSRP